MPGRSFAQKVVLGLGAILVLGVTAFVLYIAYPTAGRWLEVRALASGEEVSATVLELRANPLAPCRSPWWLGAWRRCEGVPYAYTEVLLERGDHRYRQQFFPTRLVRPLGLTAGAEVRAVAAGSRLLVDERRYGYLPLVSETLQADLWIILNFTLPLAFFWWFALNIGRLLFGDAEGS